MKQRKHARCNATSLQRQTLPSLKTTLVPGGVGGQNLKSHRTYDAFFFPDKLPIG